MKRGNSILYRFIAGTLYMLVILLLTGCAKRGEYPPYAEELPAVNVPHDMRQRNYTPSGSCVHASLITLLRWQNRSDDAERWRRKHSGGEWATSVSRKMDGDGIRYAYTTEGDVKFLEWACHTRRGAGVTVHGGAHMVTLVHLDDEHAAILDNNDISGFTWVPRQDFLDEWQASHGWAVTPVYSPHAPLPH